VLRCKKGYNVHMSEERKRLYRNTREQMLGGVCAGLGDYFDIDPTLVRLGFVLLLVTGGAGALIYIILWIVVPVAKTKDEKEEVSGSEEGKGEQVVEDNVEEISARIEGFVENVKKKDGNSNKVLGGVLVVVGLLLLFQNYGWLWLGVSRLWPLVLVGAGVYWIWRSRER
jgi:phage shock protein C